VPVVITRQCESAEDVILGEMLYPEGHPYHWPVIGYMPDLTAASYEDVVAFFKKFYSPANASLVIAGDIDVANTRRLVDKWFGDVKPGDYLALVNSFGVVEIARAEQSAADGLGLGRGAPVVITDH